MIIARKYEVVGEIGRGGMGVVYKVRHVGLDTTYALKTLPAHLASDPDFVARFHREARVMARLQHPNVVRVLDVDRDGDLQYFVMEYVEGPSLADLLKRDGALPMGEVVAIADQIALALAYAHTHQPAVVHRDIKPSNILMEDSTKRIVVTDFGIAKLTGGPESIHTGSGQFLGTLKYCAPEQLTGNREIDGRADIYALGMVIHELCTGRHVFGGMEQAQIIGRLVDATGTAVFEPSRELPDGLRRLILRATARTPEARYATANDLVSALRDVSEMLPPESRTRAALSSLSLSPVPAQALSSSSMLDSLRAIRRGRVAWASIFAAVATIIVVGITGYRSFMLASMERSEGRDSFGAVPAVKLGAVVGEEPKAIGVMDFVAWAGDPQLKWMCDAIRDTLNSQLSKAPKLKVFSKDFIDFKAQNLVTQGSFRDLKLATMQVAQELGVAKAVFGSFRADKDRLYIQAHIVDMQTGVQTESDVVEGDQARFSELQAALASKLMVRLGVESKDGEAGVASASGSSALDNYKMLLEAEGGGAVTGPPDGRDNQSRRDGGSARIARLLTLFAPGVAMADESEAAIRGVLERYREAYMKKDLAMLGEVYENFTPALVEANKRYFKNAEGLLVDIADVDIAVGDGQAAVSYTRKDNFVDATTKQNVELEVRLTKILVERDGAWKISSGEK